MDTVVLRGIKQEIVVGKDAWQREGKPQPVHISIELSPLDDFQAAASEDDVSLTVDYGKLFKAISGSILTQKFESVRQLVISLVQCMPPFRQLEIEISVPKALLLVDGGLVHTIKISRADSTNQMQVCHHVDLKQIRCNSIIGVNPHERIYKQRLLISLGFDHEGNEATLMATAEPGLFADFFECSQQIVEVSLKSSLNYIVLLPGGSN